MAVLSLAALISFVVSVNSIRTFQHGRSNKGLLPPPVVSRNIRLPPDQWIDQKLDNFNDAEPRIWRQVCGGMLNSLLLGVLYHTSFYFAEHPKLGNNNYFTIMI